MIPTNIPVIVTFLQETYRKIIPTNLIKKEDKVKNFVYDPVEPIDTVSNKIDRFPDIYELVSDLISDRQKVNLGYKIISKNNVFRDSNKNWHEN